ncbi:hypothetical protein HJG60_007794 [Phyllostomus discolor]|uniref:Uncharacterized protein n=1 Tax=Phyllostomus discolor TaxID=89673 RepID=A0A834BN75_9CHIR|nr:hypothetical protein HJG60_007794 [Phyllostomus discolor]
MSLECAQGTKPICCLSPPNHTMRCLLLLPSLYNKETEAQRNKTALPEVYKIKSGVEFVFRKRHLNVVAVFLTSGILLGISWSLRCSLSPVPGCSDHLQLPGVGSAKGPEQQTQKFIRVSL